MKDFESAFGMWDKGLHGYRFSFLPFFSISHRCCPHLITVRFLLLQAHSYSKTRFGKRIKILLNGATFHLPIFPKYVFQSLCLTLPNRSKSNCCLICISSSEKLLLALNTDPVFCTDHATISSCFFFRYSIIYVQINTKQAPGGRNLRKNRLYGSVYIFSGLLRCKKKICKKLKTHSTSLGGKTY